MELITILNEEANADHIWCGNDQTGNHTWHNRLPATTDRVTIRLSWKSQSSTKEKYIGTYRLYIQSLLKAGYIRLDSQGKVRIKFVNNQGVIRLAQGLKRSGIVVGVL